MSVLEATFEPDAPVSNVTTPEALRQPAFSGPQGTESQAADGTSSDAGGAASLGGAAGLGDGGPDMAILDIGAASFGQVQGGGVSILGTDERDQITQTTQYLWRAIASLRITARDDSQWIGTAWFISPRTLITAGHCVFINGSGDPDRDGWVKSIEVIPGRNGFSKPLGSATSKTFRSVRGWTEKADQNHDYGAIILDQPFGVSTGWFGYGVFDDNQLVDVQAHVAGYPGDKPSGTLWHGSLPIQSVNPLKVFYAIDTAGGQSGAAVYLEQNGLPIAVAVHAYGGTTSNSGTRITPDVYRNLRQWTA
jgi:V8-like Glu-specific endopeptidase